MIPPADEQRDHRALDWPQYSRGRYGDVQSNAEQAGRGLWAGSYVEPWLYRVCVRAGGSPENCSDDANASVNNTVGVDCVRNLFFLRYIAAQPRADEQSCT